MTMTTTERPTDTVSRDLKRAAYVTRLAVLLDLAAEASELLGDVLDPAASEPDIMSPRHVRGFADTLTRMALTAATWNHRDSERREGR
jgi:hypothetical protein